MPDAEEIDPTVETEAMPELGQNNRFPNELDRNMVPQDFGNQMPMGGNNRSIPDGVNNTGTTIPSPSTLPLLAVSVLVLLMGLFVAKKYRH